MNLGIPNHGKETTDVVYVVYEWSLIQLGDSAKEHRDYFRCRYQIRWENGENLKSPILWLSVEIFERRR